MVRGRLLDPSSCPPGEAWSLQYCLLASAIFLVVDPVPRVDLRALVQGLGFPWSFLTFWGGSCWLSAGDIEVDFGGGGNGLGDHGSRGEN